jgi:hypothetical protein
MDAIPRRLPKASAAALLCLLLSACTGTSDDVLTVAGSYSGTTASSCQLALRTAGDWKLVETHAVPAEFRQDFSVEPKRARYYVEVHCSDGKAASSPEFDFSPPRATIYLQPLALN